jgi:toxin CcdB
VAQFDAYPNPTVGQREAFPYFVVLQNDQFDQFSTRFAMPLARTAMPPGQPRRLTQSVEVLGERLWLASHLCATLPSRALKKPVASLRASQSLFIDALDAVISGV